MNEREMSKTLALVGVTFVLALVTALDPFGGGTPPPPELTAGGKMFPDFEDINAATTLEVFDWDEATGAKPPFKVEFKDGLWRIPSKEGYPADAKDKLGKVAGELITLEKTQLRGSREEDHALLGVVNPTATDSSKPLQGRGRRIKVSDATGKTLADVVIGKKVEGSEGLRYVRRMTSDQDGEKEVYAAKLSIEVSTEFTDWIHTDLLELDVAQITSLTIDRSKLRVMEMPDGRLGARLLQGQKSQIGQKDYKWSVAGMGPDQEANMAVIDSATEVLKELKIKDVLKRDQAHLMQVGFYPMEDGSFYSDEGEIDVTLKNGVRYKLRFGRPSPSSKTGEVQRFMIVEVDLEPTVAKGLDEAQRKEAKERVDRLNARFGDWYYVISATDFESLRPAHEKLTKKKEAPAAQPGGHEHEDGEDGEEPAQPDDPLEGPGAFPPVAPVEGEKRPEPPKDGGAQPPKDGGAEPPKDGGAQPPKDGGAEPPKDGGAQPPKDGGAEPPKDGGAEPPKDGGAQPPKDAPSKE
ncbi:MAG: DUF4340 domain-containing protein [Planctomycetota bacterium]